jgi:hypothetical protein
VCEQAEQAARPSNLLVPRQVRGAARPIRERHRRGRTAAREALEFGGHDPEPIGLTQMIWRRVHVPMVRSPPDASWNPLSRGGSASAARFGAGRFPCGVTLLTGERHVSVQIGVMLLRRQTSSLPGASIFRANRSARLIVGMPVAARRQVPPGGTVRRKGVPQADGELGLPRLTTMGL